MNLGLKKIKVFKKQTRIPIRIRVVRLKKTLKRKNSQLKKKVIVKKTIIRKSNFNCSETKTILNNNNDNMKQYHVYVLWTLTKNNVITFYTGYTGNLSNRIHNHNSGKSKYTSKFKNWKYFCYISGLPDKTTAIQCETCLKKDFDIENPISLHKNEPHDKIQYKINSIARSLLNKKFTKNSIEIQKCQLVIRWCFLSENIHDRVRLVKWNNNIKHLFS